MSWTKAKPVEMFEKSKDPVVLINMQLISMILAPAEPNPCDQHICGWGKECVVDKKGRPVCECK